VRFVFVGRDVLPRRYAPPAELDVPLQTSLAAASTPLQQLCVLGSLCASGAWVDPRRAHKKLEKARRGCRPVI